MQSSHPRQRRTGWTTLRWLTIGAALFATVAAVLTPTDSQAMHLKHLYSFCHDQVYCPDGARANGIAQDAAGNIFGTTKYGGGAFDKCGIACGTVFELKLRANGKYHFIQLYDFCAERNCSDGAEPEGSLIVDTAGNLYGMTTTIGGDAGGGEVYELMPQKGTWKLKVLYSFCPTGHNCVDGVDPVAGLTYAGVAAGALYDGTSPLYGTTTSGGSAGAGVAYALQNASGMWSEQVLHNFCSESGCTDGATPEAALTADAASNLYGTTEAGGNSTNSGVVFQLSRGDGNWSETVLHTFCSKGDCRDGATPLGGVTLDASGVLYGVTPFGGKCSEGGCGVLYRLVDNGGSWDFSVLHTFCSRGRYCDDGSFPYAAPVIDAVGDLFGATESGGNAAQRGIAYRISGNKFDRIKQFCGEFGRRGCDPGHVQSELIVHASGHVFGAAPVDGAYGEGTIFELSP
ncbi:MAG: choice-of-anchor tandem repeat GloVer-containing protein [Alphaproteobacteria bacterium]